MYIYIYVYIHIHMIYIYIYTCMRYMHVDTYALEQCVLAVALGWPPAEPAACTTALPPAMVRTPKGKWWTWCSLVSSDLVQSRPVRSGLAWFNPGLSCLISSRFILSCPVLSRPVPSCPIPSGPLRSALVQSSLVWSTVRYPVCSLA